MTIRLSKRRKTKWFCGYAQLEFELTHLFTFSAATLCKHIVSLHKILEITAWSINNVVLSFHNNKTGTFSRKTLKVRYGTCFPLHLYYTLYGPIVCDFRFLFDPQSERSTEQGQSSFFCNRSWTPIRRLRQGLSQKSRNLSYSTRLSFYYFSRIFSPPVSRHSMAYWLLTR